LCGPLTQDPVVVRTFVRHSSVTCGLFTLYRTHGLTCHQVYILH